MAKYQVKKHLGAKYSDNLPIETENACASNQSPLIRIEQLRKIQVILQSHVIME